MNNYHDPIIRKLLEIKKRYEEILLECEQTKQVLSVYDK